MALVIYFCGINDELIKKWTNWSIVNRKKIDFHMAKIYKKSVSIIYQNLLCQIETCPANQLLIFVTNFCQKNGTHC